MQIFHGSEEIIKNPQFGFGNPRNDYGLGFYCTKSHELAKEWACQKNKDGFSNCYELKTEGLSVLDLSEANFSILHWLSILMQNRVFSPKSPLGKQNLDFLVSHYNLAYSDYDIIIGYRANDSYFSFARYIARDTSARKSYLENLRNQKPESSTYLIDIVRNPELLNDLHL